MTVVVGRAIYSILCTAEKFRPQAFTLFNLSLINSALMKNQGKNVLFNLTVKKKKNCNINHSKIIRVD